MRRSMRLIDMEYKPSEIAAELNSNVRHILHLVSAGAPARKDESGHVWIHGENFAQWLEDAAPKNDAEENSRPAVAENECYCLQCRKITVFTVTKRKGSVIHGTCPAGHKVARFMVTKKHRKARES